MQEININVTETGCQRSPLLIGYQGENEVTRVIVDYSAWTEEFGAGSLALEVMRSGDEIPYLAPLTIADGKAVWLVSNVDTGAEGVGAAGFVYTVDDQIKKSAVFRFFVGRDIGGDPGERPDPYEGVIAHIEKLVKETEENAAAAETAQGAAETAQSAAEAAQDAAASSATDAAGSATTATEQAQAAVTARAAAETAQTAAETAQGAAETAQQAIEDLTVSAEEIDTAGPTVEKQVDPQTGAVNLNFGFAKNQATTSTTLGPAPIVTFDASAADMPLKSLTINIEPVQAGSGDPSPTNVRPISGWTGCNIVRSPTLDAQDGTTYSITFPTEAGTVYGGTLTINADGSGDLTVTMAEVDLGTLTWTKRTTTGRTYFGSPLPDMLLGENRTLKIWCAQYASVVGGISYGDIPDKSIYNAMIGQANSICVIDTSYDSETANAFALAMSGVKALYPLAQPAASIPLTASQITTLLGTNNIWADCGDVTVTYGAYLETLKASLDRTNVDLDTLRACIAPIEDGVTASQAYAAGAYFFRNGSFCTALIPISSGAAFTLGTNYQVTTVAAALIALQS